MTSKPSLPSLKTTSATLSVFAALLAIALVASPCGAQKLGLGVYSQGYTRCLYVDCVNHAVRHTAPWNPNAAQDTDRYGDCVRSGSIVNASGFTSCGSTVGERVSCDVLKAYVATGRVPGVAVADLGSECSLMDLNDAKLLTSNGRTALYEDMVAVVGSAPSLPPIPGECPTPRPCPPLLPTIITPSPTCPVCLTCQPVEPCLSSLATCQSLRISQALELAEATAELAKCNSDSTRLSVPIEVAATLAEAANTTTPTAALRARLVRVKAYVELTDRLQPLPSHVADTVKWLTTVATFGRGRQQAILSLREWIVSFDFSNADR